MFEYAIKIQQCISNKAKSTQILQYHCICQVLSAMDLIKNKNKIITYKQNEKWYTLLQSKNYLLSI